MFRLISNRLSVLLVSVLGSAIVLAEGAAPSTKTIEEQPFNFGTFRTIAHDQMPCVVNIISDLDNPEAPSSADASDAIEAEPSANQRANKGMGSGLILSTDGYVLTNYHVVEHDDVVQAILSDGTSLDGLVVGRDEEMDLALVKINAGRPLTAGRLGDSGNIQIGDWVMAIGSPYGLSNSVSVGIISALGRDIHSGNYDNFIQTDAAINVGNSGGPLFNIHGEVIGINSAILSTGGGSNGIGFAIPINDIKGAVEQLKQRGEVTRGWLGIALEDPDPAQLADLGLKAQKGSVVTDVWKDSPAATAGLVPGDVILGYGQQEVSGTRALLFAVAGTKIGATIPMQVLRNHKKVSVQVTIASRPEETELVAQDESDDAAAEQAAMTAEVRTKGGVRASQTAARR